MSVLAVDPGIRGCGCALFREGVLVRAAYVRSPARRGNRVVEAAMMAHAVEEAFPWEGERVEVVVEWPQVYAGQIRGGTSKGDPNDLLALCGVGAALVARHGLWGAAAYLPREWKGQLSKEACHYRVAGRLSVAEQAVLAEADELAGALAHNIWDAVGIGLHHLGRLKPHRVIPA